MIGCLTLHKGNENTDISERIIKGYLQFYPYERVEGKEYIVILTWNIKRELIWQVALLLEYSDVIVGYGFGENKDIAIKNSHEIMKIRVNLS